MRPASIEYFEKLSLLSILVGVVLAGLSWDASEAAAGSYGFAPIVSPIVQAVGLVLVLLLVLLISRKASVVAKWIFVILFVLGLVYLSPSLPVIMSDGLLGLLALAQLLVQAVAIYFLFTAETRAWLAGAPVPSNP